MKYAGLILFAVFYLGIAVGLSGNANQVHRLETPKYFPLPTQKEPDLVVMADEKDKLRPPEEGRNPNPYALEKRVMDLEAKVQALQKELGALKGSSQPAVTDAAACATCGTVAATTDDGEGVGRGKGRIKKLIGRILHR